VHHCKALFSWERREMVSQAQRDALAAPITEWLLKNPVAGCRMHNGRRDLIVHVKGFCAANLSKNLTDDQVRRLITGLLNKHRPGIIRPEKTSRGKRKALGGPGAKSKEENDKYNKKHSKKRKTANEIKNHATIVSQGLKHIMRSKTETEELCERLLSRKYAALGGLAMRQAIEGIIFGNAQSRRSSTSKLTGATNKTGSNSSGTSP
jgi:hypothetical protein